MGPVEVPDNAYYGPQTQRAVENFPISGKTMPPELIHALGLVKWACAKANAELGLLQSGHSPLSDEQVEALLTACLEVAEGKFDEQFPVDVYQTGSGTSTNMNANEVIARRANELVSKTTDDRRQTTGERTHTFIKETTDGGLSGLEGLAEGDGFDGGNLSAGEKTAERGNIRTVRPDAESGGLDSIEHSGGQGQEFQQGIHPISAHSERIEVGTGNTTSDKRQSGLSDRDGHSTSNGDVQGDRSHVVRVDCQSAIKTTDDRRQTTAEEEEEETGGAAADFPAVCRLSSVVSIHPNDHVNMGQSTNDVFPTAIHVALTELLMELRYRLVDAQFDLEDKATAWQSILKIGRTHLADATPLTLGQEFSGYAKQIDNATCDVSDAEKYIRYLPIGGTAVGTGINTHSDFSRRVIKILNKYYLHNIFTDDEFEYHYEWGTDKWKAEWKTFYETDSHFASNSQRDDLVKCHAAIKSIAVTLFNIANNIRWLGSGPRCGFYEIIIPDLQPGSSIMPGKVNPVLCEALMQACARVIGNDQTMTFCGATGGQFQLNIMMPVMADTAIESVKILAGALEVFTEKCLKGLEANEEKCREGVEKSLAMATALNPHIGYEKAAEIAKEAFKTGKTVREVCLEQNILPPEQLDEILDPWKMVKPQHQPQKSP